MKIQTSISERRLTLIETSKINISAKHKILYDSSVRYLYCPVRLGWGLTGVSNSQAHACSRLF